MAKNTMSTSLPAPVGGWNARDSEAAMPPMDARFLVNWFPGTSDVMLRNGCTLHADGMPDQVESIAHYAGGSVDKLFAWSSSDLYDITSPGTVGAAEVTGLSNARWQFTNVANSGGNYLIAVNGADNLLLYDGSAWAQIDGSSSPAITGVATTSLSNVLLFKHRVWFIEKGTLNCWYLGTDAISGAATKFSMDGIATQGGYLVALGAWTIDAGYGVDDLFVAITSKGEIIVYKGTDPANSSTWEQVGVWHVGAPAGARCLMKYAGDLLVICQDGLLPLAAALQSSRLNPKVALTDKIQYAMSNAISIYGGNFGWTLLYYPKSNMLFLNVPVSVGLQEQFVMNTITKNWCNFTGWAANCWELYNDEPYFGSNGKVYQAWNGFTDDGEIINGSAAQAYNYFAARGQQKRWTLARPMISANGTPSVQSGIDVDFDTQMLSPLSVAGSAPTSAWDTAIWDSAIWGGGLSVYRAWQGVNGIGFTASYRLQAASQGVEIHWLGTDIVMERGGVL